MTTTPDLSAFGVPPISQIGIVVRDLDAALAFYGPLFGPFTVVGFTNRNFLFHGRPADCELRVAYGWSGDIEVELLQPVSGDSPQREALERCREGLHHVQFRVAEIDPWITKLEKAGYSRLWEKRSGSFGFVYLESPLQPVVLEFVSPLERSEINRASGHLVIE